MTRWIAMAMILGACRTAEERTRELFQKHCIDEPGALWDEDELAAFKVRAVYGLDRLREKVLVWREGLDDRIIELVKMHILAGEPRLMEHRYSDLIVNEVSVAEDRLKLYAAAPRGDVPLDLRGTLAIYRELVALGEAAFAAHRLLYEGTFVDYRRFAFASRG